MGYGAFQIDNFHATLMHIILKIKNVGSPCGDAPRCEAEVEVEV